MTTVLSEPKPVTTSVPVATRIQALDWTKGALIVFMVIYHSINYSKYRPLAFEYLAFLPPSFILITGFIVGQIYTAKYDLNTLKPYARLAIRGLKLLTIFAVLNVGLCIVQEKSFYHGFWLFVDRASATFLSGNGRVAIFEVLLPIAYFLLIAPVLLLLRRFVPWMIPLSAVLIMALCWILELTGISWDNLILLSAGFIGMALGIVRMQTIDRIAARWISPVILYGTYRILSHFVGDRYWIQMLGAIATVLLLYTIAQGVGGFSVLNQQIVKLGNYSLFTYLAQIAMLQVIVRGIGKPENWMAVTAIIATITLLLVGTVYLLEILRQRSRAVDSIYRFVFA